MVHAHNKMLKGITKVAYIMDVIYKNIDKVPSQNIDVGFQWCNSVIRGSKLWYGSEYVNEFPVEEPL